VAANFLWQWASEPEVKGALLARLKDEHPLVREKAVRSLEPLVESGNSEIMAALKPMLDDPVRNVRVAAAWVLRATLDLQSRAGRDLQTVMDLDADQPTGQYRKAMFQLARQQPAEAVKYLRKAVEWDTYSPPFRCKLAEVLSQMGQTSEALAILDRAETLVPGDPHIPYVRAEILLRNGRVSEARGAANRALEIQRDFVPAMELLQSMPAN
jgi:tetratricopeptide (TPR) repeat protein